MANKGHRKATHLVQHHKRLSRSRRNYRTRLMFQALKDDNVLMMKQLLKDGGLRMNARSAEYDGTFLHVAVFFYHCNIVIRHLVRAGCRINSRDSEGDTALHLAVRYHRISLAIELIRLGANVRARNKFGETPLQLAVANKSHVDPLDMIPNSYRYSQMNFSEGLYSLSLATAGYVVSRKRGWIQQLVASEGESIYGRKLQRLVKVLLGAGADINAKDINDCSPIHCAVYTGDVDLLRTLVDAGADLNHRNDSGVTALHDAVFCCNEAMVHLLLSRGAKVNIVIDDTGDTVLHWAAKLNIQKSHNKIIRKLMEFGSDLNHENEYAETPFHHILQFGDVDLVRLFIDEYNADLNKFTSNGSSALTFAAQNEHEDVMDLVLKSGLQINHRCAQEQRTSLHGASAMSLLENVRRLISRGADVNAKDIMDRTPLFHCMIQLKVYEDIGNIPLAFFRANYAEERGQVLRLLLESGADVNHLADTIGESKGTILEVAIMLEDVEASKIIIEYAAKVEARTNKPLFDEYNLRLIDENPEVESYYQKCRAELAAMGTAKIEGSLVSYMSVLTEKLDVVARYARNDELAKNFQSNLPSYPIYMSQLKDKFNAAMARRKTIEEVSTILSTTLQFADPSHVAFEKIIEYLCEADIRLLVGSAAVIES